MNVNSVLVQSEHFSAAGSQEVYTNDQRQVADSYVVMTVVLVLVQILIASSRSCNT